MDFRFLFFLLLFVFTLPMTKGDRVVYANEIDQNIHLLYVSVYVFVDVFVPLSSKTEALTLPLQNAFLFDFLLVVGESLLLTSFRCAGAPHRHARPGSSPSPRVLEAQPRC